MDKINIKNSRTAKKYAEALFAVAVAQNVQERVLSDINTVVHTIEENADLIRFLDNPVVTVEDKKDVVRDIFQVDFLEISMNFLYLLADNSRFNIINEIKSEYIKLKNEYDGIITIRATSAVEIKDYLREKLKYKLESILSKNIKIEYFIDEEIIGGLIIEINGKIIDTSIRTKIKNIKKKLI